MRETIKKLKWKFELATRGLTLRAMAAEAERDELRRALEESVKLQSHYACLLNAHDGGQRLQFANGADWMRRLKELPQPVPSLPVPSGG